MKEDPRLNIIMKVGRWHDHFKNEEIGVDFAVLLNPGFQSQLYDWYDTLSALRDRCVPVVITGHDYGKDELELCRMSSDRIHYPHILHWAGFNIVLPPERNPFAQQLNNFNSVHPNLHAPRNLNGFLMIATGSGFRGLPYSLEELHKMACVREAELNWEMEVSWAPVFPVAVSNAMRWRARLAALKSGKLSLPCTADVNILQHTPV